MRTLVLYFENSCILSLNFIGFLMKTRQSLLIFDKNHLILFDEHISF